MENIKEQIAKKEKEIEELKAKLEVPKVIYENKTIKIIKWENKEWGDFPMPKGWDFCKFEDFVKLYDDGIVKLEIWKYYVVKHFSTKQQKTKFSLSRVYLDVNGGLVSCDVSLADSADDGRVVIQKQ